MLEIQQIPVLNDNYIYLIHDSLSKETAVIDPAVASPVIEVLKENNWRLTYLLNTHHHSDHVGGNLELKQQTQCQIVGAAIDEHRIPGIDQKVQEGDTLKIGSYTIEIINCAGHTTGHIAFYIPEANALFCGDTLFAMGCGRLFEGSAEQMQHSLAKFSALPLNTQIYCAHEYTLANSRFALSVEPHNNDLLTSIEHIKKLTSKKQATIPTTLEQELATNPFLRTSSPEIKKNLAMPNASNLEIFTELRERKNSF